MLVHQQTTTLLPYQRLAVYYDRLMDYIDYDTWVSDIQELAGHLLPGNNCLDISCGTGAMAILLARQGRKVKVVDISPHMLEIAREKARQEHVDMEFEVGNMTQFNDGQRYDLVFNLHDGMNYLLEASDIESFLTNSHNLLNSGGVLLFDVVTPKLCQSHFRDYREIYQDDAGGYERQSHYDPISQMVETVFTFSSEQEQIAERETHFQKAYTYEDVLGFCESSPFTEWTVLDDETLEPGNELTERFIVRMVKT